MANNQQGTTIQWVKSYTLPRLSTTKDWFIYFYAFDPAQGKLRRKKIRVSPKFDRIKERRMYAHDMMERITLQLRQGWNPWLEFKTENSYATWQDACDAYRNNLSRLKANGLLREKTEYGYLKMLEMLCGWNSKQLLPINYAYQCDYRFLIRFTDWLWLDRGLSATTRDNYVTWLKTFGAFLRERNYLEKNPAEDIKFIGSKIKSHKNRTIIQEPELKKLGEWAKDNNKHFYLACCILYYCFVRPKEMSFIQLKHFNIKKGTLFIPDFASKNGKEGTVTMPDCIIKLMIELDIFNYPDQYYLFSDKMKPGKKQHSSKQFSDFWTHAVRKELRFPLNLKFYSLKDTGITNLIKANTDLMTVRNQARHHSLLMTDIYTPHDIQEASDIIRSRPVDF